jgi:SPP1 gp7 family putative phage head morphogenesis protein
MVTIDRELMVQPERAMAYWAGKVPTLKKQLNALSEDAQTKAFVISKLNNIKQLQQVYDGIAGAMSKGKPMQTVVNELKQQGKIQLSTPHLRTVVNTNLKMAYGAGRWEEIQASKEKRPYLQYIAIEDERTRASHWALNDMIFPVDDPFWQVNMPPNDFNCRCQAITLSQRQVDRLQEKLGGRDPVFHSQHPVPINKDFAGIPGQTYKPDLSGFQPAFREQFLNDIARHFSLMENGEAQLKRYFNTGDAQDALALLRVGGYNKKAYTELVNKTLNSGVGTGLIMPAGKIPPKAMRLLNDAGVKPRLSLITIDDKQILHMQRTVKQQTGQVLTKADLMQIPEMLRKGDTEWFYDSKHKNIIVLYPHSNGKLVKVAIGAESKQGTPYIVTSGIVDESGENKSEYKKLR